MSPERDEAHNYDIGLTVREARLTVAALIAQPISFAAFLAAIAISVQSNGSLRVPIVFPSFAVFGFSAMFIQSVVVRIAKQEDVSLARGLYGVQARLPWSLMCGRLGNRVFERAGWRSLRHLQRALLALSLAAAGMFSIWVWAGER